MVSSLPAYWYADERIYRSEREKIFAKHWWLLGPEHDVVLPGAYVCDVVCGWPVFVLRGEDGKLRGFHNVCRHRASALLDEGTGCLREIRCPYHGWLYNLDGDLTKTPNFGEDSVVNDNQHNLFPIRVDTWHGLVFICVDQQAPDLQTWLGSADKLCQPFPPLAALEYHDKFVIEGRANWKTYCDNTVEGYHLSLVHPRLAKSLAKGSVEIKSYDDGRAVAFHVNYGSGSDGAALRGQDGLWLYLFPGFQLVAGATTFKAERVEPSGARALRSCNWAWYGDLNEQDRQDAFDWARQIVQEDLAICETVQRNVEAGAFKSGPLSPAQENHVIRLQELVRSALANDRKRGVAIGVGT